MPRQSSSEVDAIGRYLGSRGSRERLSILKKIRAMGISLPLPLVFDLLCLDLPLAERAALLDAADGSDPELLEELLTRDLLRVDQHLAILALEAWHRRTERRLWRRLLELPRERLPVRVMSFCLEHAWSLGGRPLLEHLMPSSGLEAGGGDGQSDHGSAVEELAGATQALLLRRLTQWSLHGDAAMEMAERLVLRTLEAGCPSSPATVFASEYVARFEPENLYHLVSGPVSPRLWADHLLGLYQQTVTLEALAARLAGLLASPPADDAAFYREFFALWPPVWLRHLLPHALIAEALAAVLARPVEAHGALPGYRAVTWELFAGIPAPVLAAAVAGLKANALAQAARSLLGSLLAESGAEAGRRASRPLVSDDPARSDLIGALFRDGEATARVDQKDPWSVMLAAFRQPGSVKPKALLAAGRKLPAVYAQCLFRVIERHAGCDELMPALFDQIDTQEPGEQLALAQALAGLGTPRALALAVSSIGRSSVGLAVKLEICQLLLDKDLGAQQAELRQMIAGLERQTAPLSFRERELADALKSLLVASPGPASGGDGAGASTRRQASTPAASGQSLDAEVRVYVPRFDDLPLESQRALRMGRLILRTVNGKLPGGEGLAVGAIDVSPLVDLQYKSLEIFFRAHAARPILELIQAPGGALQRKLDLIGYGRPGSGRVDAFEAYLMGLPVVADIPEFSHFKLRRVLTAIASHRPGKRFVLDGLKAYAVVYLTFGRQGCDYGLHGLLPTGFATERELLEFCRDLHILHAIRNQTAHEGLTGHRIHEAEALWHLTGSIFARSFQVVTLGRRPKD